MNQWNLSTVACKRILYREDEVVEQECEKLHALLSFEISVEPRNGVSLAKLAFTW